VINQKQYPALAISDQYNPNTKSVVRLYVSDGKAQIIIEPNLMMRGSVYPTEKRDLVPTAVNRFKAFVPNVPIVSVSVVYAGKICAVLDRQHSRDLFDIKLLL